MSETLGQRIKAARKARGLTQAQVAEKMGVKYQSVEQLENGKRDPRFSTLKSLALAIGCPMSELTGETEAPPTERAGYRKTVHCDGHVTLWTPIKSEDAQ